MSDLVGTPEDRFSHNEAQVKSIQGVQRRTVLVVNVFVVLNFFIFFALLMQPSARCGDYAWPM